MKTKFKWTVEFEIDPVWVADGFNLTDENANLMILSFLSFARSDEVNAKVIKAPDPALIRKEQGYDR